MILKTAVDKRSDGTFVITVSGALNTETYQQFEKDVKGVVAAKPKAVILDLAALDYISSMGISALLSFRKAVSASGGSCVLMNVPASIKEVFRIVNALPDVPLFKDIEEADRYFSAIQRKMKEG